MIEQASGACRECLQQVIVGEKATCPELLLGPLRWSGRSLGQEHIPEFTNVALAANEAMLTTPAQRLSDRSKSLVSGMSAVGRRIAEGYDSEIAIQQLSKEAADITSNLMRSLILESDPSEQVKVMMLIGFVRNIEGTIGGLVGLNNTGKHSPQSIRDSSTQIVEASSLAAKGFISFLSNDKSSAFDAQTDFKLLTLSIGRKEGLALKPALLWSLSLAVNSYYSLRLMMS